MTASLRTSADRLFVLPDQAFSWQGRRRSWPSALLELESPQYYLPLRDSLQNRTEIHCFGNLTVEFNLHLTGGPDYLDGGSGVLYLEGEPSAHTGIRNGDALVRTHRFTSPPERTSSVHYARGQSLAMAEQEKNRPVEILLVEDNPGDVRLTQEALKDGNVPHHLSVVHDGEAALSFLRREPPYVHAVRPDLILLDLNLPKKDGRQVLEDVKTDDDLREIPVLVLTTSRAEYDIASAYDLQANCYIQKPVDLNQFWTIVRWIEKFWLTTAALPSQVGSHAKEI